MTNARTEAGWRHLPDPWGGCEWCSEGDDARHEATNWPCDAERMRLTATYPPAPFYREALSEMVAAYTARPDVDETDHPGGLTTAQVELAWTQWSLRQQHALLVARAALRAEGDTAP